MLKEVHSVTLAEMGECCQGFFRLHLFLIDRHARVLVEHRAALGREITLELVIGSGCPRGLGSDCAHLTSSQILEGCREGILDPIRGQPENGNVIRNQIDQIADLHWHEDSRAEFRNSDPGVEPWLRRRCPRLNHPPCRCPLFDVELKVGRHLPRDSIRVRVGVGRFAFERLSLSESVGIEIDVERERIVDVGRIEDRPEGTMGRGHHVSVAGAGDVDFESPRFGDCRIGDGEGGRGDERIRATDPLTIESFPLAIEFEIDVGEHTSEYTPPLPLNIRSKGYSFSPLF
jgi:hypothetical protein